MSSNCLKDFSGEIRLLHHLYVAHYIMTSRVAYGISPKANLPAKYRIAHQERNKGLTAFHSIPLPALRADEIAAIAINLSRGAYGAHFFSRLSTVLRTFGEFLKQSRYPIFFRERNAKKMSDFASLSV
jgi:hypothetical protein